MKVLLLVACLAVASLMLAKAQSVCPAPGSAVPCTFYEDCRFANLASHYRCENNECVPPECTDNKQCAVGRVCAAGLCKKPRERALGQSCNRINDYCADRGVCICSTGPTQGCSCKAPVADGVSCVDPNDYQNGNFKLRCADRNSFCNSSNICEKIVTITEENAPCVPFSNTRRCANGMICDDATNTCKTQVTCEGNCTGDGSGFGDFSKCKSNVCGVDKCEYRGLYVGDTCYRDDQCLTNKCEKPDYNSAGVCAGQDCSSIDFCDTPAGDLACYPLDDGRQTCGKLSCNNNKVIVNGKCKKLRGLWEACTSGAQCESNSCSSFISSVATTGVPFLDFRSDKRCVPPFVDFGQVDKESKGLVANSECMPGVFSANCEYNFYCRKNSILDVTGKCKPAVKAGKICDPYYNNFVFPSGACEVGFSCTPDALIPGLHRCTETAPFSAGPCNTTADCPFGDCFCDGNGDGICSFRFDNYNRVFDYGLTLLSDSLARLQAIYAPGEFEHLKFQHPENAPAKCQYLPNLASGAIESTWDYSTGEQVCQDFIAEVSCFTLCSYDGDLQQTARQAATTFPGDAATDYAGNEAYITAWGSLLHLPGVIPEVGLDCSARSGKGSLVFPAQCLEDPSAYTKTLATVRSESMCSAWVQPPPSPVPSSVLRQIERLEQVLGL